MRWDLVFFYSFPVLMGLLWLRSFYKAYPRKPRATVVRKVTLNHGWPRGEEIKTVAVKD